MTVVWRCGFVDLNRLPFTSSNAVIKIIEIQCPRDTKNHPFAAKNTISHSNPRETT